MTEYDYSPEAVQAYHAKLQGVQRWVDTTNQSHFTNPFTSVPTITQSIAADIPRSRSKHRSKKSSSRYRSNPRMPAPVAKPINYPYATHYHHSQYTLPNYPAHYVAEVPPPVPFVPPFVPAAQYIPNQNYTRPVVPVGYTSGYAAPPQRSTSRNQHQYAPRAPGMAPSPTTSYTSGPKRSAFSRFFDRFTGGAKKSSTRPGSPAPGTRRRHHRERRSSF
ncbi:hypothetical protein IW261DRAFT_2682 [Armillaria novae-zelandiae]|uniref:Uncharacterized protein n=1 Tax=Armillaria novae-zelandiae TaxID=153914 RepID=A0AA39PTG4_9AGAR|nr:hypothetical protein IW261DRAFT_2682 [Armillaria novae-zelandiae]